MRQQVKRGKDERTRGQIRGGVHNVSREEIARILRKLMLRQRYREMVQVLRLDEEQQDAASDLQQSIETLRRMPTSKTLSSRLIDLNTTPVPTRPR